MSAATTTCLQARAPHLQIQRTIVEVTGAKQAAALHGCRNSCAKVKSIFADEQSLEVMMAVFGRSCHDKVLFAIG